MLDADQLKNRLDAARTLRGMTQEQLAAQAAEDGLGKHDVGRLERGQLPMTRARRQVLARILRVPEAWFVDAELDLQQPTEREGTLEGLHRLMSENQVYFRGLIERVREERIATEGRLFTAVNNIDTQLEARTIREDRIVTQLAELTATNQALQATLTQALDRLDQQHAEQTFAADVDQAQRSERVAGEGHGTGSTANG